MGASSIEIEYSAVYHSFSLCCDILVVISLVYSLPASNISVCSLKKGLRRGRTTVITTSYSKKTSYSWSASVIWILKTYSRKFGVNLLFYHFGTFIGIFDK